MSDSFRNLLTAKLDSLSLSPERLIKGWINDYLFKQGVEHQMVSEVKINGQTIRTTSSPIAKQFLVLNQAEIVLHLNQELKKTSHTLIVREVF